MVSVLDFQSIDGGSSPLIARADILSRYWLYSAPSRLSLVECSTDLTIFILRLRRQGIDRACGHPPSYIKANMPTLHICGDLSDINKGPQICFVF